MRNTLRAGRILGRRFKFVMRATMSAGFWGMMSNALMLMLIETVGLLLT